VWSPSASSAVIRGDAQAANEPLSILHWNVEPPSFDANRKVGVESFVGPLGPSVIAVWGGAVSTLNERLVGTPVWPSWVARTWSVWPPSASVAVVCGEVHAPKLPASSLHSNEVQAGGLSEPRPKLGVESLVAEPFGGPEVNVALGAGGTNSSAPMSAMTLQFTSPSRARRSPSKSTLPSCVAAVPASIVGEPDAW
jgi:hypothetical protein